MSFGNPGTLPLLQKSAGKLLKIKDSGCWDAQDFPIVKFISSTPQDRSSLFCVEPSSHGQTARSQGMVRRKVSEEAGRGLEKLAHALEYLTDEFVHDGCRIAEDSGRLQAIQLLASLNRQIYFACGVEPTVRDRVQNLFRRLVSQAHLRN